MITTVIVDDEKTSRDAIKALLQRYCPEIQIIGEADSCQSAILLLKKQIPTLVFLDILMPDGSGFDLLEEMGDIPFEVIFVTAFDQFAIRAIKISALDYLLKPVSPEDLQSAIQKLKKHQQEYHNISKNVRVLLNNVKAGAEQPEKMVLKSTNQVLVVEVNQIVHLESDDCYTHFYFSDGSTFLVSKTLKEYEELLNENSFVRIHKSHMVNLKYIKQYHKFSENYHVELQDGTQLPVSRRKREKLNEVLNHL